MCSGKYNRLLLCCISIVAWQMPAWMHLTVHEVPFPTIFMHARKLDEERNERVSRMMGRMNMGRGESAVDGIINTLRPPRTKKTSVLLRTGTDVAP
jgi:hypothetical protein